MSRYLIDANHFGIAIRRSPSLRERIRDHHGLGDRFGICIPVLCEVEAGLHQMKSPQGHRLRMKSLLQIARIWPLDEPLASEYGDIFVLARGRGRVLSFVDILLVAMARKLNAVLLTTDRDFEAFPEIRTENWVTP